MIVPKAAVQLTALLLALPCTVAENCTLPLVCAEVVAGETVTLVTVDVAPAAVTFTVADADFVVSATLVAVTVSVPTFAGAVYWPADVIVPS